MPCPSSARRPSGPHPASFRPTTARGRPTPRTRRRRTAAGRPRPPPAETSAGSAHARPQTKSQGDEPGEQDGRPENQPRCVEQPQDPHSKPLAASRERRALSALRPLSRGLCRLTQRPPPVKRRSTGCYRFLMQRPHHLPDGARNSTPWKIAGGVRRHGCVAVTHPAASPTKPSYGAAGDGSSKYRKKGMPGAGGIRHGEAHVHPRRGMHGR